MGLPQVLRNFSLFVDGRGYAGLVEEITLPKLTLKVEEYIAGGMDAPVELDMGMEKLECDFTVSEYNPELFAIWGMVPGNLVNITLRGGMDKDGTITPIIVSMTGTWKELDLGSWKAGEKAQLKVQVAARFFEMMIGGVVGMHIDVPNMVRIVNGVDQLANMRAAIGI